MKLYYYPGAHGVTNFGDELNTWLWPQLIPECFSGSDQQRFVGIGTLLNNGLPADQRKIIFGSGVGYGNAVPRVDEHWKIYFVRGPLSAKALEIPASLAITDAAILTAQVDLPAVAKTGRCAYIPHWENANGAWQSLCAEVGMDYIDPRWPLEQVLEALRAADLVLAEAMHGAIIADTFRVPWIPIKTRKNILDFKWMDWCQSMEIVYKPVMLLPYWELQGTGWWRRGRQWIKRRLLATQLRRAARQTPFLSDPAVFQDRLNRATERLRQLRDDFQEGRV